MPTEQSDLRPIQTKHMPARLNVYTTGERQGSPPPVGQLVARAESGTGCQYLPSCTHRAAAREWIPPCMCTLPRAQGYQGIPHPRRSPDRRQGSLNSNHWGDCYCLSCSCKTSQQTEHHPLMNTTCSLFQYQSDPQAITTSTPSSSSLQHPDFRRRHSRAPVTGWMHRVSVRDPVQWVQQSKTCFRGEGRCCN
jgi:hypothetical protein